MEVSRVYAIALGGSFCLLLLLSFLPLIVRMFRYLSPRASRLFAHRYVLRRHWLFGQWSIASVGGYLIYIGVNILCLWMFDLSFRASTVSEAGIQAGTLAIINLIPLLAVPHLGALADLLDVTLNTFRQIHRSAGVIVVMLTIFHVSVMVALQRPFPLYQPQNLCAVIGASSLCFIILLSLPLFRRLSYELFLRIHQLLAALTAYSIWRHLPSEGVFPRLYLYISAGLFLLICIGQMYMFIRQNGFLSHTAARADITNDYGAVRVRIRLQKPLCFKAGQVVNLWIPSLGFWYLLQSHPFVVISWAEKPQDHLDLFIEPRKGLTRKLLSCAKVEHSIDPLVLFSGPHGKSIPMHDYESILMVTSDFGIAAHLPYLKQLIYGYNAREVRARRVHLVWQVHALDVTIAAQPLLNAALNEDTLDNGWILAISIYCEPDDIIMKSFGKRANVYPGKAPLQSIFQEELSGEHVDKKQVDNVDWQSKIPEMVNELESGREGKMLVTVSANNNIRDKLRDVVRDHLPDGVSFFELDYQPHD